MSQSPLVTAGLGGQGLGVSTVALAVGWSCVSQNVHGPDALIAAELQKEQRVVMNALEQVWTLRAQSAKTQAIKTVTVPNLAATGAATQV